MTDVFNAQSDAVIVFKQNAQLYDDDQGFASQASFQPQEPLQEKLPEFLFTNKKSIDLFGIDLQELKPENRQLESNFMDEKRFICLNEYGDDLNSTESQRDRNKNQYKFMDDLRLNVFDRDDQRSISLALLLKRKKRKGVEIYKM